MEAGSSIKSLLAAPASLSTRGTLAAAPLPLPRILIIDSSAADRSDVAAVLRGRYQPVACATADEARRALGTGPRPALVLIDDSIPSGGGRLLHLLRRDGTLDGIPVLATCRGPTSGFANEAKALGAAAVLYKPYAVGLLRRTLSALLNSRVEAQWDALEPIQRDALKNTVAAFNTIAETVSTQGEVPYATVRESCTPLVQAVANAQFRDILSGVRNHDDYTYAHSLRVATFLTLFGHGLGLRDDDLLTLTSGGLLHDIGKIAIPLSILNKPGALDAAERGVMRTHVRRTMDMLLSAPDVPRAVTIIAGQHHERPDGTGYPLGLSGTSVNELARMAAIADMFVALTDRRAYKPPMAPEDALGLMTDMGSGVDQILLRHFREVLLDMDLGLT